MVRDQCGQFGQNTENNEHVSTIVFLKLKDYFTNFPFQAFVLDIYHTVLCKMHKNSYMFYVTFGRPSFANMSSYFRKSSKLCINNDGQRHVFWSSLPGDYILKGKETQIYVNLGTLSYAALPPFCA